MEGRRSRCCHWGPVAAMGTSTIVVFSENNSGMFMFFVLTLGITHWVVLTSIYCNTQYWPPAESVSGLANMLGFFALTALISYHFCFAICVGPGYLPLKWRPANPDHERLLQFCHFCQGFKAPRSHHCRKCRRCVQKMDHHCPWINNCVGHRNHGHFIAFLTFAVIGCMAASYVLAMSLYYGLNRSWYATYGTGREPIIRLTLFSLLAILFALGLALGVVLAVGALLIFQLRSVWRNQTGIEDWIMEKAAYRLRHSEEKFVNPYDIGGWKNVRLVLTGSACLPVGDGIDWPLRQGATQYDMTIEQLLQKEEKRERTREYRVTKDYSGSWCPIMSAGFATALRPPLSDESRIPLQVGDIVRVTRWKKYWLYGERNEQREADGGNRARGWFPRKMVVDVTENKKRE